MLLVGLGLGQPTGGRLGTAVIFPVLFARIPQANEAALLASLAVVLIAFVPSLFLKDPAPETASAP